MVVIKTIGVQESTKLRMDSLKLVSGESYDSVIQRLVKIKEDLDCSKDRLGGDKVWFAKVSGNVVSREDDSRG